MMRNIRLDNVPFDILKIFYSWLLLTTRTPQSLDIVIFKNNKHLQYLPHIYIFWMEKEAKKSQLLTSLSSKDIFLSTIKRGKYYYLASIPWEEICYIVIFPEGNGFLSFFFSGFREMAWEMVLYNTGIQ